MILPPVTGSAERIPVLSACASAVGRAACGNDDSGAAVEAPLGTNAKSSLHPPEKGAKATRALRYQAQSQARHILTLDAQKRFPGKHPGNVYRTAACRYVNHAEVGVNFSQQFQAAHYAGLVSCGSVWACPVCASRIQERRRLEIEQAISWAESKGLDCVLVTFTFPHRSWHHLGDLLTMQADAFKRLRKGRPWDKLKRAIGFKGLIRSLEVTHGSNGWHPHTHELWLVESPPSQSELAVLWERACRSAGLLDDHPEGTFRWAKFMVHSVDVKRDMTAGDYLAKQDDSRTWGMSHEVAKATSKAGKAKGVHPHHFLVRKAHGDAERFLEYVSGMKGKRQLFWSPGLKSLVGVDDLSDEVVADESREAADLLGLLTPDQWKVIRGNDARAELLDAAERGGWDGVRSLMASLGA